jgi:membrane fusion protein (multidrug efflux system)
LTRRAGSAPLNPSTFVPTQSLNPSPCLGVSGPRAAAAKLRRRIALPTALLTTAFLCGCKKPEAVVPPPPLVEVMEIQLTDIPMSATLIGQLDSPENVQIRARVEAFVQEICFVEGANVAKDAVLFKLDKQPFIEKEAAAKAEKSKSEAALRRSEADLARIKPLAGSGAVSMQDLDNATAAVEASKASVEAAQAKLQSAQLDLSYCDVKAPIAGLIGAKEVSVGDFVGKGEPTLLATMSALDPMWFYCNVSEVEYVRVKTRARELGKEMGTLPLTLVLPTGDDHPEKGSIVFLDRAVDPKTGTMRVRAQFPNPTEILRPGMFSRARVEAGTRKDIKIPERAIVELQGRAFVWVVDKDGKANQRPVKTGEPIGSEVAILDGLKVGERIIVEGVQKVREGARVNALTAGQIAAMQGNPAPTQSQP